ncbi:MAG: YdcF family protein [Chitinophagales bacterium]|nr:YdcF family protein [Chitinophagales bacterium]
MKRFLYISIAIFSIVFFLSILFHKTILISFARYLMVEDTFASIENGFVLSGNAYDRGTHAATLYNKGKIRKIICTGENQSPDLKVFGNEYYESDLTKMQMLKNNVPDSAIIILKKGTSTLEEADAILAYCKENNIDEIALISGKFHTRRVQSVFKKKFKKENIRVLISGAPSSAYNELQWWQNEYGLIALNNEYIKLFYYRFKS